MSLVLRKDTLTPLTYEQMDGNFEFLQTEITELQSGIGISPEYIRSLFFGGPGITYDQETGEIKFIGGDNVVTSINGQTGAVRLTGADLNLTTTEVTEGSNAYFTQTRAWDAVKDRISVSGGLSKTFTPTGMNIAAKNFNIALVGDIVGSAKVTDLGDVVIDTRLFGVTVDTSNITVTEGVIVRSPPTVPGTRRFTGLDFDPNDFLVTDAGNFATIKSRQNSAAVVEIVGNAISGTVFGEITQTESGIDVTFDRANGAIRVAPRDFKITLTGAVTGEGTVTRLRDVTINTLNSQGYITGFDAFSDVNKVNVDKLTEFQFDVNAFEVRAVNKRLFLTTRNTLTPQDVRDIIGNTIQGTEQDVDLNTITETGIIFTYDRANNTLSVAPRDFTITLAGAVTGSVRISRLRDATLNVINSNNYISGLDVFSDSNKSNNEKITQLQFNSQAFDLVTAGNRAILNLKDPLTPQDVRDIVGETVKGTQRDVDLSTLSETGIIVTYDRVNNTLSVAPRNFEIEIVGAVSGKAVVSRLRDTRITVENINNYIQGVDVFSDVNKVNANKINEIQFDVNDFGVSTVNNRAYLRIKNALNAQDVRDIIGNTVQGTEQDVDLSTLTETGIIVTYDRNNNTLSVAPRSFTITLDGAVAGQATITRLRDVTLTTQNINNYISGFDVFSDVNQVNTAKITELEFDPDAFEVSAISDRARLKLKNILSTQDVRDIIGNTVQGTEQDVDLSTLTETGIIVTYDRANNTLSVAPRNFTITIDGAVSGQATITRLRDVTLTTFNTSNFITGLDLFSDVNKVNTLKITELQFDPNAFEITPNGNRATLQLKGALSTQDVRDIIGNTISGTEQDVDLSTLTETGIIVTYDRVNNNLSVAPRDFTITIDGAVTGSAKISRLRDVTLTTFNTNNYITGFDVYSDVNKVNNAKITEIQFNPNAFTVTAIGNRTILDLAGTLTAQDVRDIIGNTIQGTEQDVDLSTLTETGIIATYDRANNTLSVAPRNFTITLDGAVAGQATITRLRDVTLTTQNINNYISGFDVYTDVNKVNAAKITEMSFNPFDFEVTALDNRTSISLKGTLSPQDVRDIIGTTIAGTEQDADLSTLTETGIIVNYDRANNTLSVAPRNFTITLAGAVTGSATISRLRDVTLNVVNSNEYIPGVDVLSGVVKKNIEPITSFNFEPGDFNIVAAGHEATLSLKNILSPTDVRDIIGATIVGTETTPDLSSQTETGIIVRYNAANQSLSIAPRDFVVTLTGAVTGTATVRKLRDITIATTNVNNYISGLDVYKGTTKSNVGKITDLEFDAVNFDVVSTAQKSVITLKGQLTPTDVRTIIGQTVTGTETSADQSTISETGINVRYNSANGTLSVAPRNFTINVTGAATGTVTITRLRDATLNLLNSNNYISGLDVFDGVEKKNVSPIKSMIFDPDQFTITTNANEATIRFNNSIDTAAVRDIIGTTVLGESRDPVTGRVSDTGILVSYDRENNYLSLAPQDFSITLIGDVTGTATISKLRSVTMSTTTSAIKGIGISSNSVPFDSGVKNLNFSSSFALTRDKTTNTLNIDVANIVNNDTILSAIGGALTGAQNGISVVYNSTEKQFRYNLANLAVNLQGAISGSATLQYSGSGTQTLDIITEIGQIGSGLDVKDEGETKGTSVSAINFVGGGVTTAVSMDGTVATVSIPNSPAAEKFLLVDQGSANVTNARRLTAGTGIVLQDGGPGGDFTISASGGEVLGKIQVTYGGQVVGEQATVNFVDSQQVFFEVTENLVTNSVNVTAYSLLNGWYRKAKIDNGTLTDKYGNSLDMGPMTGGIIENQINLGDIA